MPAYSTNAKSAFVCTPTDHFKDFKELEVIVGRLRKFGLKPPPVVESALESLKVGENVEDSMNAACDGVLQFYLAAEQKCSEKVGAKNVQEVKRRGDWQLEEAFDNCVLVEVRKWQKVNIDNVLNPFAPDSAISVFIRETKDQVLAIASKWIKKRVLKKASDK